MEQLDQLWYEMLDSPSSKVIVFAASTEDVIIKAFGANGEFVGEVVEGVKNESNASD